MPTRRPLYHTPPPFVPDGNWFFLTLCCARRGLNQLCSQPTSATLLADAAFYHRTRRWTVHLLLLMPDHLHALVAFPAGTRMSDTIRHWKRLTARRAGVVWQRNYFDHRLRPGENLELKARYIRENPLRAGLVTRAEDWPYYVDHLTIEGR
ncbi:MAG: transposase [Opitutae bacterium]|nr:transposase [Opitutae bacterium]